MANVSLYVTLVVMLLIVVVGICYLFKSGSRHINFEGKFGPTSAKFTVDRDVPPPQE